MVMSVHHITEQLQNQHLADQTTFGCNVLHEKVRHHSEPARISSKCSDARRPYKFTPCCGSGSELSEGAKTGTHISLETPPLCIHGTAVNRHPKGTSASVFNPPDPPKKRHCRSLSIPGDQTWPEENAVAHSTRKLHRPVAVRPHLNNNHKHKNRNSPLMYNKRNSSSPINSAFSSISPVTTSLTTSDYFSTPPDSPVPRPASVSSGYYDSPLSAPWLEHCSATTSSHANYDLAKSRSLSFEGRISDNPSGDSMPATTACVGSTPSSPRRQRILRCHSQPCVLHERERKCGVKRRHGEDRPSLNFDKMNEKLRSRAIPQTYKPVRSLASVFSDPAHILDSIASSPLDSHIPSTFSPPKFPSLDTKNGENRPIIEKVSLVKSDVSYQHAVAERSDSGCYVTAEDPPDIFDSHHDDWSCRDRQQETVVSRGEPELMFPLDCSSELDLDQIEND